MATPDVLQNDKVFNGTVTFGGTLNLPSGAIPNAAITAGTNIDASKIVRHQAITHVFADVNTNPSATTHTIIHMTNAVGTLVDFKASITGATVASTNDTLGVNLYRSASGGAWATVLSDTVALSTDSVRVPVTGAFSNTTMADGDTFSVTCTVSSTVSASGLACTLTFSERFA